MTDLRQRHFTPSVPASRTIIHHNNSSKATLHHAFHSPRNLASPTPQHISTSPTRSRAISITVQSQPTQPMSNISPSSSQKSDSSASQPRSLSPHGSPPTTPSTSPRGKGAGKKSIAGSARLDSDLEAAGYLQAEQYQAHDLSSGAQLALDFYKQLHAGESLRLKCLVDLSLNEYAELQHALHQDPSLHTFIQSKFHTVWLPPTNNLPKGTLCLRMTSYILDCFTQHIRNLLEQELHQISDYIDNPCITDHTRKVAGSIEMVPLMPKMDITLLSQNGGSIIGVQPDISFIYDSELELHFVVEVGFSQAKASLEAKASQYLDSSRLRNGVKTVLSFNLPYQYPAERLASDPLPHDAVFTVPRATRNGEQVDKSTTSAVFIDKDGTPRLDADLTLYLTDFYFLDDGDYSGDVSFTITFKQLGECWDSAVRFQKIGDRAAEKHKKELADHLEAVGEVEDRRHPSYDDENPQM